MREKKNRMKKIIISDSAREEMISGTKRETGKERKYERKYLNCGETCRNGSGQTFKKAHKGQLAALRNAACAGGADDHL